MNASKETARARQGAFYYAGLVLVAAIVFGGGQTQGLVTDHLIEVIMLPAVFMGLGGLFSTRTGVAARLLVIAVLALGTAQFLPVWRASPAPELAPDADGWAFWSRTPQQSLESVLFTVCAIGFALFVSRFSDRDQERLLRFVFLGFFVQLIAGVIQLSYDREPIVSDLLAFTIRSGLFANENHYSSLFFCVIPAIAWYFLARGRRFITYIVVCAALVFFLFAVGSRAGMAISALLSLVCLFWFGATRLSAFIKAGLLGMVAALMVAAGILAGAETGLEGDLRLTIFATTWQVIRENWLFGTGLGSFTTVYPSYEASGDIFSRYVNHAHSDYLEIFMETGIAGPVLIIAFLMLVLANGFRSRLSEAALIAVLALMLHSIVDYPLRTFAVAVPFALYCGIVFSTRQVFTESTDTTHAERRGYEDDFVPLERVGEQD